jgi:23S rRNA pseudouridine2605 synthase
MANDEDKSVEGIRLQKVLASAGVASRRVCEQFIVAGKVRVNNKVVTELGTRINPDVDKVSVNGSPIQLDSSRVYLALNKPFGVVSSMNDENGRPDLAQFVVEYDRVYNVGRLDAETTGLIIMTNDGDLAHKLAHPKFGVKKTYLARVEGLVEPKTIAKLLEGIELEDGPIAADECRLKDVSLTESLVEIVLHSGKNRIVRRMMEAVGHPVLGLVRQQFGPIRLGHLKPGQVRDLNKLEIGSLIKEAEAGGSPKPRSPRATKTSSSRPSKRR